MPGLDTWRKYRARTGGTDTARYCYSVWLRHLLVLNRYGFEIAGARVGELGPGDSIGIGLAALLSGAAQYVGLDIVPFSTKADLNTIFEEIVELYARREPIPDHDEFPRVRPRLESYEFPDDLIDWSGFWSRAALIRGELTMDLSSRRMISYKAPWTSSDEIAAASLDLIFSQAVLEHVDDLEQTYKAMFLWLKSGGYAYHVIDFTSHGLSPFWNGHWAYSDFEWRLTRGRREFLLNREPLSTHLTLTESIGFELLSVEQNRESNGLAPQNLAEPYRRLGPKDHQTSGAVLILHKS